MSCDAPPCQAQVNFRSGHAVQERVDLVKDKCWKSQVPFDHALVWHSPSSQGPHVSCKGASASAAASHWIGSIGSCFFFCSIKSSSVKLCSSYIYYIYILLLCLLCLFASLPLRLSASRPLRLDLYLYLYSIYSASGTCKLDTVVFGLMILKRHP